MKNFYSNVLFEMFFVLLGTLASAFVLKYLVSSVLKNALSKTKTRIDDEVVQAISKPLFLSVFLVGAHIFVTTSKLEIKLFDYASYIILSFAIVIWGLALEKIADVLLTEYTRRSEKGGKTNDAIPFLRNISRLLLAVIGLVIILSIWGLDITPLVASAGVLGIAIAFAAKDTISNLFGGISVFFDKPYKVGDYVIIENNYRGEVVQIGMRSTKIKTRDSILITVPNSVMVTNAVINETGFEEKLRIRIPVGVSYDSDLENVEYILVNLLKAHDSVIKDPPPKVRFRNFGSSAVELEALAVIDKPENKGRVTHELIKEIFKVFGEEKIHIPYPQTDVHLHNK